jgi:hypothetical protein
MSHDTHLETSRTIPHYWVWLAALGLAVTVAYAVYEVMKPAPPRRIPGKISGKVTSRPVDISRGSRSSGFRESSPVQTSATTRWAASAENVAKRADAYCAPATCSFQISDVRVSSAGDRTVTVLGEYPGSTSELTYTCVDCSAALNLDVHGIPEFQRATRFPGPGLILTLNADATAVNIECRAQACTTRQDTGEARQLLDGRSVSLPIKQGIHLTFSRAGMSPK